MRPQTGNHVQEILLMVHPEDSAIKNIVMSIPGTKRALPVIADHVVKNSAPALLRLRMIERRSRIALIGRPLCIKDRL